jgi:hypothetical protein
MNVFVSTAYLEYFFYRKEMTHVISNVSHYRKVSLGRNKRKLVFAKKK